MADIRHEDGEDTACYDEQKRDGVGEQADSPSDQDVSSQGATGETSIGEAVLENSQFLDEDDHLWRLPR